jgi:hypothetical protein
VCHCAHPPLRSSSRLWIHLCANNLSCVLHGMGGRAAVGRGDNRRPPGSGDPARGPRNGRHWSAGKDGSAKQVGDGRRRGGRDFDREQLRQRGLDEHRTSPYLRGRSETSGSEHHQRRLLTGWLALARWHGRRREQVAQSIRSGGNGARLSHVRQRQSFRLRHSVRLHAGQPGQSKYSASLRRPR